MYRVVKVFEQEHENNAHVHTYIHTYIRIYIYLRKFHIHNLEIPTTYHIHNFRSFEKIEWQ
jgi:hypothetical protein